MISPCRHRLFAIPALMLLLTAPWAVAQSPEPAVDPALFQAMEWRLIGPFRGGRVTAVAGVRTDPLTFYFGATGSGVWKSEDAGTSWKNVSDGHFGAGSVGALAVAESDPNVVYASIGEAQTRGVASSHGDGVYRSTDGGATWVDLGLARTRQISRIRVHPEDPDLVWVAAQGNPWRPNRERGVYRSRDGGRTWLRVLYVDDGSGASDLAVDPTNPRVLYAAFWQHRRRPWKIESGGPGSGPLQVDRRRRQLAEARGRPPRGDGQGRGGDLSGRSAAGVGDRRGRGRRPLPLRRRRREVAMGQPRAGAARPRLVLHEGVLRRPPRSRHRVGRQRAAPALGRRRAKLHPRRDSSWRQPRSVDLSRRPAADDQRQRRRRQRLDQRQRHLVAAAESAHRPVLPRRHRPPLPLPGLRRPTGQLDGGDRQPLGGRRHRARGLALGGGL